MFDSYSKIHTEKAEDFKGLICKKSFFSVPAGSMFQPGRKRRFFSAVAILAVTPLLAGAFFATSFVQAKDSGNEELALSHDPIPAIRLEESSYLKVVPYETLTVADPEMLIGETEIICEGKDGIRRVTETLEYEDDMCRVSAVSSTFVVESVAETIAIGTAKVPSTASKGHYIWPSEGVVSSWFGPRSEKVGSRNHQGIDIAGSKGDSIYAADGGEVILADSSLSGYGLLVQIKHDNGDVTYYGHNSKLLVEPGERVYQGQEIAKMGSTGVSTGVHLHFEIRVDGKPVNPAKHLPDS